MCCTLSAEHIKVSIISHKKWNFCFLKMGNFEQILAFVKLNQFRCMFLSGQYPDISFRLMICSMVWECIYKCTCVLSIVQMIKSVSVNPNISLRDFKHWQAFPLTIRNIPRKLRPCFRVQQFNSTITLNVLTILHSSCMPLRDIVTLLNRE